MRTKMTHMALCVKRGMLKGPQFVSILPTSSILTQQVVPLTRCHLTTFGYPTSSTLQWTFPSSSIHGRITWCARLKRKKQLSGPHNQLDLVGIPCTPNNLEIIGQSTHSTTISFLIYSFKCHLPPPLKLYHSLCH